VRWLSSATVEHLRRVAEWPDLADTKYRLIEELGRGGMGAVYLADDTVLGRRVALKVVATGVSDPAAAERMLREARIIARLEHPGIVPVHDAGALPDGRVFYAMKRVDGSRLDALAPGMPIAERLRVFQRVCDAVAFAHAHGVVHRDLKPENVMVGAFGEVLVMDWGIARLLESAADDPSARPPGSRGTAAGSVMGTLSYMAPEQAAGAAAVGPAADVYALGGILYYLLTLRAPFEGERAEARARTGGADAPPDPPSRAAEGVAPALEAVVVRAMAGAPEARYASAEELSVEVARYLDGERVLAHSETAVERAGRFFARYKTAILLVAAYLVVRGAMIWLFRR
jgi:eukaryotic-like serine/threonine-protein kinase